MSSSPKPFPKKSAFKMDSSRQISFQRPTDCELICRLNQLRCDKLQRNYSITSSSSNSSAPLLRSTATAANGSPPFYIRNRTNLIHVKTEVSDRHSSNAILQTEKTKSRRKSRAFGLTLQQNQFSKPPKNVRPTLTRRLMHQPLASSIPPLASLITSSEEEMQASFQMPLDNNASDDDYDVDDDDDDDDNFDHRLPPLDFSNKSVIESHPTKQLNRNSKTQKEQQTTTLDIDPKSETQKKCIQLSSESDMDDDIHSRLTNNFCRFRTNHSPTTTVECAKNSFVHSSPNMASISALFANSKSAQWKHSSDQNKQRYQNLSEPNPMARLPRLQTHSYINTKENNLIKPITIVANEITNSISSRAENDLSCITSSYIKPNFEIDNDWRRQSNSPEARIEKINRLYAHLNHQSDQIKSKPSILNQQAPKGPIEGEPRKCCQPVNACAVFDVKSHYPYSGRSKNVFGRPAGAFNSTAPITTGHLYKALSGVSFSPISSQFSPMSPTHPFTHSLNSGVIENWPIALASQQQFFSTLRQHYYPERGWGWVVTGCVLLLSAIQTPFVNSPQIILRDAMLYFRCGSITISVFLGSLSTCLSLIISPFVVCLSKQKSPRLLCFLGSIICALGLLFTSFATQLNQMASAYCILFGIGSGLLRESSSVILSKYFKRRRVLVEMIICFFTQLGIAFLPILLSYAVNVRNWRFGLQMYSLLYLLCFCLCILMRPASLYHPQRRAILHLKSLQKKSKLKNPPIKNKKFIDLAAYGNPFRYLKSKNIQIMLCSAFLLSFGMFTPLFLLCPSLFYEHNYPLAWLYFIQLTIGLSGAVCPPILYLIFHPQQDHHNRERGNSESKVPVGRCNNEFRNCFNPLRLLQCSSLLLTIALFMLAKVENVTLNVWLLFILALYGIAGSFCSCLLRLLVMSKVRARSVGILWAWFECAQALPILIGPTISAFLNERFGSNKGFYLSAGCTSISVIAMVGMDFYAMMEERGELRKRRIEQEQQRQRAASLATIGLVGMGQTGAPFASIGTSDFKDRKKDNMNRTGSQDYEETRRVMRERRQMHRSLSNNSSLDSGEFAFNNVVKDRPKIVYQPAEPGVGTQLRMTSGHSLDSLLENCNLMRKLSETTSGAAFSNWTTSQSGTGGTGTSGAMTGQTLLGSSSSGGAVVGALGNRRLSSCNSMPDLNALLIGGQILLNAKEHERLKKLIELDRAIGCRADGKSGELAARFAGHYTGGNNLSSISEEVGLERILDDLHRLNQMEEENRLGKAGEEFMNEDDLEDNIFEEHLLEQEQYVQLLEQLMHTPVKLNHDQDCPALKFAELLVDKMVTGIDDASNINSTHPPGKPST